MPGLEGVAAVAKVATAAPKVAEVAIAMPKVAEVAAAVPEVAANIPAVTEVTPPAVGLANALETSAVSPHGKIEALAGANPANNIPTVETQSGLHVPTSAVEGINSPPAPAEGQTQATQPGAENANPQGVQGSQEANGAAQQTEGGEASKVEGAAAEAQQARTEELRGKIEGDTATADEVKEYREAKQKENADNRRQELKDKALEGTITDDELTEWQELKNEKKEETSEEAEKPLTELEQTQKEIEDIGTEMMQKLSKGEELDADQIAKLQALKTKEAGLNQGLTPEEARQLAKNTLTPELRRKAQRELAVQRSIREQLQQLMGLEMQLLALPQRLKALEQQKKQIVNVIKSNESKGLNPKNPDMKKRMELYGYYMTLANIKAEIVRTKDTARILHAQYKEVMAYVRRKLGVTHGLGAFLEWAGAKATHVTTELGSDAKSLAEV